MQIEDKIHYNIHPQNTPKDATTFKAGISGLLSTSGNVMQNIENGGFLASFLIQDTIGMTLPRTCAGFMRDKEITGRYNIQEGTEVLGREGLTGPCMMAVAPIMLLLAAKFGRSTSVNSSLIKRFGNSLKNIVNDSRFNKELLSDKNKFKENFYKTNLENMLYNTLGKENVKKENIEFILKELNAFENPPIKNKLTGFRKNSKYRQEKMNNIIEHINDIRYKTNSELNLLGKLKVGENSEQKVYKINEALEAMIKYSDDAIVVNKHFDKLDSLQAESLKNQSIAKRLITNISTIFATLGVLSVLPKIYARSNTAPGARKKLEDNNNQNNSAINFKGKNNILDNIGKKVASSKKYDKLSSELEYNGHNFTNSLMAGLSLFGLLTPRGMRAYNRAEIDEKTGKRDLTELWEILIRDVTSSLAVVFVVPMLTRACVTGYEKNSGFVLMDKNRNLTKSKTILDLFNPYSKAHVLTNSEISSIYDRINSKEKMLNFCNYINNNNGDLEKIISKSEHAKEEFSKKIINLDSLKQCTKKDKNQKIIDAIKDFGKQAKDNKEIDEIITKVMKGAKNSKGNKIAAFARGLNSIPGLLTTFLISPYLLGWAIPRLTYKNTQRIHAKQDKESNKTESLKTTA